MLDYARVKATLEAVFQLDADMRHEADITAFKSADMQANLEQKTVELASLEARLKEANERMKSDPAGDRLAALRADAQVAEEALPPGVPRRRAGGR